MGRYFIGLDLGQANDYSALAALRVARGGDDGAKSYDVVKLARQPLGTLYTAIVAQTKGLLMTPEMRGAELVVDRTGVGAAVVDMFKDAGMHPHAITITGGLDVVADGPDHTKVPKRDLVGELVKAFQTERLRIARRLDLASVLVQELLNFRRKENLRTGHDSYEAWRESDHDDLVLAAAIALWRAENAPGLPFGWLIRSDPSIAAEAGLTQDQAEDLY